MRRTRAHRVRSATVYCEQASGAESGMGVVPFCTGGRGLANRLTNVGTVLGAIEYARGSRGGSGATT